MAEHEFRSRINKSLRSLLMSRTLRHRTEIMNNIAFSLYNLPTSRVAARLTHRTSINPENSKVTAARRGGFWYTGSGTRMPHWNRSIGRTWQDRSLKSAWDCFSNDLVPRIIHVLILVWCAHGLEKVLEWIEEPSETTRQWRPVLRKDIFNMI